MEDYRYYIDKKQTIWVRDFYTIEAASDKEALLVLEQIFKGECSDIQYFTCRDNLYDASEEIPLSKEHPVTKEAFTDEGEVLFTNQLNNESIS